MKFLILLFAKVMTQMETTPLGPNSKKHDVKLKWQLPILMMKQLFIVHHVALKGVYNAKEAK
eukprot:13977293-Ditylum_brightwellii.AAC.1